MSGSPVSAPLSVPPAFGEAPPPGEALAPAPPLGVDVVPQAATSAPRLVVAATAALNAAARRRNARRDRPPCRNRRLSASARARSSASWSCIFFSPPLSDDGR